MSERNSDTELIAAVLTPLTAAGELHLARVEQQAELLRCDGISSVFVAGTTGEFSSLTTEERLALARRWLEVGRRYGLTVLVHVGSTSVEESRTLAADAQVHGAAGIAALSPYYFKPPTAEVLIDCLALIAAAAPALPFYYYHIPALTGVAFALADWFEQACARIPNLAGAKYTHTDLVDLQWLLHSGGSRWRVFYGVDEQLLAAWALGARGAVGSNYNFATPYFRRLLQAAEQGDWPTAQRLQARAAHLIGRMLSLGYWAAAKELLRLRGLDLGPVRPPLRNLTPEQAAAWRQYLEQERIDQFWSPSPGAR